MFWKFEGSIEGLPYCEVEIWAKTSQNWSLFAKGTTNSENRFSIKAPQSDKKKKQFVIKVAPRNRSFSLGDFKEVYRDPPSLWRGPGKNFFPGLKHSFPFKSLWKEVAKMSSFIHYHLWDKGPISLDFEGTEEKVLSNGDVSFKCFPSSEKLVYWMFFGWVQKSFSKWPLEFKESFASVLRKIYFEVSIKKPGNIQDLHWEELFGLLLIGSKERHALSLSVLGSILQTLSPCLSAHELFQKIPANSLEHKYSA